MRTFGHRGNCDIPRSVDEPMAPLNLLYWAIYACLKSHAKDIDPSVELEMAMYLANNELTMIVPKKCADAANKAAKDCYILRNLKFTWGVETNDEKFQKLIGQGGYRGL